MPITLALDFTTFLNLITPCWGLDNTTRKSFYFIFYYYSTTLAF